MSSGRRTPVHYELWLDIPFRSASGFPTLLLPTRKGFYALEALRRVPEGTVAVALENEEAKTQLERLTSDLPELSRPIVALPSKSAGTWVQESFGFSTFDKVIVCEALGRHDPAFDYWAAWESALASARDGGSRGFVLFDILGGRSSFLSEMLKLNIVEPDAETAELIGGLAAFETKHGGGPNLERGADRDGPETIGKTFHRHLKAAGIDTVPKFDTHRLSYERTLFPGEAEGWLSAESDYGKALRKARESASPDLRTSEGGYVLAFMSLGVPISESEGRYHIQIHSYEILDPGEELFS